MTYRITLINGDGIGSDVVPAARKVIDATGVSIDWEEMLAGDRAMEKFGDPVPQQTVDSILRNKVAIKGPLTNQVAKGWPSPNMTLRAKLGLFAQVRHTRGFEGVTSPFKGVDLVVVREATEDTYAGAEQKVGPDAAVALKFITRATSENVTRFTLEYARKNNRRRVTVALKANILKLTDGLMLHAARSVAPEFPDIKLDDVQIDNLCYQMVKNPCDLDVILTTNVYGDIVSDLAAGIAGSLGLGYGGNFGPDAALFEPVHGTAPKYAGLGVANPIGLILSGAMMLNHIGEEKAAKAIESAVEQVIKEGKTVTKDLGGKASTNEIADAIITAMK
jgi:isocitrate dehydrogenase (NAD+)